MNKNPAALINKYINKGVFVDTNLLLLWFVGTLDRKLITKFKRTEQFAQEDFDTIDDLLCVFNNRVTIPNVLTEVSNLAKLGSQNKAFFTEIFPKFINIMNEQYVSSSSACGPSLSRFGLTDACILSLVKGKYLLLTDDFRLSQFFTSIGGDAINFNHIRMLNWKEQF